MGVFGGNKSFGKGWKKLRTGFVELFGGTRWAGLFGGESDLAWRDEFDIIHLCDAGEAELGPRGEVDRRAFLEGEDFADEVLVEEVGTEAPEGLGNW